MYDTLSNPEAEACAQWVQYCALVLNQPVYTRKAAFRASTVPLGYIEMVPSTGEDPIQLNNVGELLEQLERGDEEDTRFGFVEHDLPDRYRGYFTKLIHWVEQDLLYPHPPEITDWRPPAVEAVMMIDLCAMAVAHRSVQVGKWTIAAEPPAGVLWSVLRTQKEDEAAYERWIISLGTALARSHNTDRAERTIVEVLREHLSGGVSNRAFVNILVRYWKDRTLELFHTLHKKEMDT